MAYKSPPLVVDCGDGVTISVFSYHRCAKCYEVDKPSIDGERFPYIFSLYFSPTGLCIVIYTPEIPGILPFHLYWRLSLFLPICYYLCLVLLVHIVFQWDDYTPSGSLYSRCFTTLRIIIIVCNFLIWKNTEIIYINFSCQITDLLF